MILPITTQLIFAITIMLLVMGTLWAIQLKTKDAGLVDVAWSYSPGMLSLFFAATTPGIGFREWILTGLLVLWSLRLGTHVLVRNHGQPEDARYAHMRQTMGDRFQLFLLGFFLIQGLLGVIFSLGHLLAIAAPSLQGNWRIWETLAFIIGLTSVGGEMTADWQLSRFKKDSANKGKTCRAGLWRYSRHPNYFFEWLQWWVWPLAAAVAGWWWLITLIQPALMLFFLLRVSGIPATEAQSLRTRGDDYRRYQNATSPFVPWFPNLDAERVD